MSNEFRVVGDWQFRDLAKSLERAAELKLLRKEMNKSLRVVVKPLIAKTREVARQELPKRGGLAALVAKAPQRVRISTGSASAGIKITAGRKGSGARGADAGTIRHPVFGHTSAPWKDQQVKAGWFTATLDAAAPQVEPALLAAMDVVAEQIARF